MSIKLLLNSDVLKDCRMIGGRVLGVRAGSGMVVWNVKMYSGKCGYAGSRKSTIISFQVAGIKNSVKSFVRWCKDI